MNKSTYDGTGRLGDALAALCGVSPKSQAQIAKLIKQAKDALGIDTTAKVLPPDARLKVWQWHYDRLHSSQSTVEIISQLSDSEPVEIISQVADSKPVEIFSQLPDNDAVEIDSQAAQSELVEIYSQPEDEPEVNNLDVIRIGFYVTKDGKRPRQVIALDGFYLNGLIAATGITRQDVPRWIQAAVNEWIAFDAHLPITRQVKYLIVRTMTEAIEARAISHE